MQLRAHPRHRDAENTSPRTHAGALCFSPPAVPSATSSACCSHITSRHCKNSSAKTKSFVIQHVQANQTVPSQFGEMPLSKSGQLELPVNHTVLVKMKRKERAALERSSSALHGGTFRVLGSCQPQTGKRIKGRIKGPRKQDDCKEHQRLQLGVLLFGRRQAFLSTS